MLTNIHAHPLWKPCTQYLPKRASNLFSFGACWALPGRGDQYLCFLRFSSVLTLYFLCSFHAHSPAGMDVAWCCLSQHPPLVYSPLLSASWHCFLVYLLASQDPRLYFAPLGSIFFLEHSHSGQQEPKAFGKTDWGNLGSALLKDLPKSLQPITGISEAWFLVHCFLSVMIRSIQNQQPRATLLIITKVGRNQDVLQQVNE